MFIISILSYFFIGLGLLLMLIGIIQTIILPDLFLRLHAATKCTVTGAGTVIIGFMFYSGSLGYIIKLLLILVFLFFTSPIISHLIGISAIKNKYEFLMKKKYD